VTHYRPDVTNPELRGFNLYHDGRLVLYFSEPVETRSFNVTGIMMEVGGSG
jgi:hypothetical protein